MKFDDANHLQTLKNVLLLMEEREYNGSRKLLRKEINRLQKYVDELKREERKKYVKVSEPD